MSLGMTRLHYTSEVDSRSQEDSDLRKFIPVRMGSEPGQPPEAIEVT